MAEKSTEYMERNLLLVNAELANKATTKAKKRLAKQKRPCKWLLKAMAEIEEKTAFLSKALENYRDSVK